MSASPRDNALPPVLVLEREPADTVGVGFRSVHASVVPIAIEPEFGAAYALLTCGADEWIEGSARWSAIGGRVLAWEAAEEAVARELEEEGCGALQAPHLHADLLAGRFILRTDKLHPLPLPPTQHERLHTPHPLYPLEAEDDADAVAKTETPVEASTQFWIQLPWDPDLPSRFLHARGMLAALDKAATSGRATLAPEQVEMLYPSDLAVRHARHTWLRHHRGVRLRRMELPTHAVVRALTEAWGQPAGGRLLVLPQTPAAADADAAAAPAAHGTRSWSGPAFARRTWRAAGAAPATSESGGTTEQVESSKSCAGADAVPTEPVWVVEGVTPGWLDKSSLRWVSISDLWDAVRFGAIPDRATGRLQAMHTDLLRQLQAALPLLARRWPAVFGRA